MESSVCDGRNHCQRGNRRGYRERKHYRKGKKVILKGKNNEYELVSQGKRGNDIVLTIDIDLQRYLEDTLTEEVLLTKSEPNTKYYNRTFAIISNPNTGEILAMAGKQVQKNKDNKLEVIDYTPGIVTLPITGNNSDICQLGNR